MQKLRVNIGPRAFDIFLYLPKLAEQQCPAALIHTPAAPQPGPRPAAARLVAQGGGGPGKQIHSARLKPCHFFQAPDDAGMIFFVAGQGFHAEPPTKRPRPASGRFRPVLFQD